MAFFLAVANRKGGVGKSTIAVMLAHAAAVLDNKRVLILDLDSQCNASLILLGGQGWSEARRAGKTIADYLFDMFDGANPHPREYLLHGVGDVADSRGQPPRLSLLPGSLLVTGDKRSLAGLQEASESDPACARIRDRLRGKVYCFELILERIFVGENMFEIEIFGGESVAHFNAAIRGP